MSVHEIVAKEKKKFFCTKNYLLIFIRHRIYMFVKFLGISRMWKSKVLKNRVLNVEFWLAGIYVKLVACVIRV